MSGIQAGEPRTLLEAVRYFSDPDVALAFAARLRWPDGKPVCPRCGGKRHSFLATRRIWKCRECKKQFSVKVGTIFEDSPLGLDVWLPAIWLVANSKNGISSHEMARALGITQKSAWFLNHRIRLAMQTGTFAKLDGVIEVDETFVGGKAKNRHKDKRGGGGGTGGVGSGKTPIAGAVGRKGNVVARVIECVDAMTLTAFVRDSVSEKVSLLVTDHWVGYKHLAPELPHAVINHAAGQYVVGAIHTNTIEGFWSIFKRGVVGSFHKISKKYMLLYVAEFQFRYNNRTNSDIFGVALNGL
jgi:transposase-like protein